MASLVPQVSRTTLDTKLNLSIVTIIEYISCILENCMLHCIYYPIKVKQQCYTVCISKAP